MDRRTALKRLAAGAGVVAGVGVLAKTAKAKTPAEAPPGAVGMLYDTTRCIGCKACVVACSEANNLPPDTGDSGGLYQQPLSLNAKTKNVIKLYRGAGDGGREEQSYVKAQCMHCLEPACTTACMMHALSKDERGIVSWDGSKCVGCRYCQVACPFGVPQFEWSSYNPRIVKCELCRHRLDEGKIPACCEVCPREAVIYGAREELLAEAHRRIKENPKLYVPKVYGERDGGGTQVLYLSHVPFEKIGLPALGDRPVPETVRNVQGTIYYGFMAPLALYGGLAYLVRRNQRKAETDGASVGIVEGPRAGGAIGNGAGAGGAGREEE
jgi:Fe-S-cluster-containing dehydrogenase component